MKSLDRTFATKHRGFAILEALIAFIVLAVGLLVLLNFNNSSIQSVGDAKVRLQAIDLAQGKLQELRSFLDNDDTAGATSDWNSRMANGADTLGAAEGLAAAFNRSWTVDLTDPSIAAVAVTVTWNDRDGTQLSYIVNSDIYDVDPTTAAAVLHTAIVGTYDPSLGQGGGSDPDDPKVFVPNSAPEEGPFTLLSDPDDPTTSISYHYRLTISGEVDKKSNQDITLPEPQVTADFGAVCDFGSTAAFKKVKGKIDAISWDENTENLSLTSVTNPSGGDAINDLTFHADGTIEAVLGAELGAYDIVYEICPTSGCTGTTSTTSVDVEEFDGSFICYAYFQELVDGDANGDGELTDADATTDTNGDGTIDVNDVVKDDNFGWTGSLGFSVSGSGDPVFCFPLTGVIIANSSLTSAFGQAAFTKPYTNIVSNQNLFLQIASGINGCAAQL